MLAAAADGAIEGDWIVAARQTGGRGRLGRGWASPEGNVYASGLVRLRPTDPDPATLALVAAVALYDTVAIWLAAGLIRLKWPNDLLAVDRGEYAKLAGILLERVGDAIVIGCGVNLVSYPSIAGRALTSMREMGVMPPEPPAFVEALAEIMVRWCERWRVEGVGIIRTEWLARAHPKGTALAVNLPDGEAIEGLFEGLTAECALRLRLANGAVHVVHAGDVFWI